ncbi:F-box/kelch-repeat protein At3g23880-like [Quercus lobata]|uniref:F-box domain-containing protein n=1 Tax=Quercus lobata TaxID=97700 RepID=A0A7N2RB78_QUELO|nr:F-box/kelch-repeat protein At3g23880-like [Quercus lobata]XP_030933354.1 F-box/kelch-repeat protein At3g23880-like [Quercus lobata]
MSQRKKERGAILRRRTKRDDLPDEIVLEILARLPVKSLLRFRCVCKPWYSSIAKPSFISTHHLNHSHHGYVIHIPRNIPAPSSSLARDGAFETIPEFRVPFTFQSQFSRFVGSCNGLLCFTGHGSKFNDVYLWNPSIRKFKRLPNNQFPLLTFGIGYDSQNNDFKLVGISQAFANPKPPPEAEVFSLSSDSWKRVELGISLRPNLVYCNFIDYLPSPFVSGRLHWMFKFLDDGGGQGRRCADLLLSFDVSSEKFNEVPLPNEGSCFTRCVTSFKGKLALIEIRSGAQPYSTLCSIWVMREYGVIDSWNKLRVLSIENLHDFIGFTEYGLHLVQKGPRLVSTNSKLKRKRKYVLIDPKTLHEKEISTQADYRLEVATYMENLALLDGRNVVSY